MKKIVVFLGAPGAGKGTAAAAVAASTGARHVSTGAMLRDAVSRGTPAGLEAKSYMDAGALVPDEVLYKMVVETLVGAPDGATLFFDGFPRNLAQAEALAPLAKEGGAEVAGAICLDVAKDALLARLGGRRTCPKCGAGYHVLSLPPKVEGKCDVCGSDLAVRDDDKPETIAHRLEIYESATAPVIGFYEKAGALRRIDASGSAAEVADLVLKALKEMV
ncbi:MAG: adenylate kinase [Kiritimatiellae bacterium]|nr:adenylate kinase [Kiritimatiellia bacterium]